MKIKILKSKIHRATVKEACLDYEGSISIDVNLMNRAGIVNYEKVHVLNVTNGERLETYAIPSEKKGDINNIESVGISLSDLLLERGADVILKEVVE